MDIENRIEKLTEKIRELDFKFEDAALQKEADEAKEEAISLLESYIDLKDTDLEQRKDDEKNEDEE